jgi:hypothetical protein
MPAEPNHLAGRAGIAGAVLNVLGVLAVSGVESAYRPEGLERWYYAISQGSTGQQWSAWCFAVGLLLLVPWVAGLARVLGPYAWPGAGLVVAGALVNVVGSLLPYVVAVNVPHGEAALGQTMLGLALVLDAFFNLAFGAGLVLLAFAMARDQHFPMWMPAFGLIAGLVTTSVVAQAWSPLGADMLALAGPLWIAWVVIVSWRLMNLKWESWETRRSAPELNRLPLATPYDRSLQAGHRADDRPAPPK